MYLCFLFDVSTRKFNSLTISFFNFFVVNLFSFESQVNIVFLNNISLPSSTFSFKYHF